MVQSAFRFATARRQLLELHWLPRVSIGERANVFEKSRLRCSDLCWLCVFRILDRVLRPFDKACGGKLLTTKALLRRRSRTAARRLQNARAGGSETWGWRSGLPPGRDRLLCWRRPARRSRCHPFQIDAEGNEGQGDRAGIAPLMHKAAGL
jgi:hypothetical protein